ncbi:hypothetical protein CIPAW_16G015200 [Carya illinoinensis]|uniref:Uncharacterized protein n=1 Tax=Carya illinoinensis TaxID=32201 RepID=A0A8T1N4W6_CARIL|nr:hypothetical protein CIPAW_16G015200 [Carya illinoinensis]
MLTGKRVKLFPLKFRNSKEDKPLRSSGSAPSNRLQKLRLRFTKKVIAENKLGNNMVCGALIENKTGEGGPERMRVLRAGMPRMRVLRAGMPQMTLGKTKSFLHSPRLSVRGEFTSVVLTKVFKSNTIPLQLSSLERSYGNGIAV